MNKSLCSHICVGAPNGGHVCLCPDEMKMVNGVCMCPGDKPPFKNGTCPQGRLPIAASSLFLVCDIMFEWDSIITICTCINYSRAHM